MNTTTKHLSMVRGDTFTIDRPLDIDLATVVEAAFTVKGSLDDADADALFQCTYADDEIVLKVDSLLVRVAPEKTESLVFSGEQLIGYYDLRIKVLKNLSGPDERSDVYTLMKGTFVIEKETSHGMSGN